MFDYKIEKKALTEGIRSHRETQTNWYKILFIASLIVLISLGLSFLLYTKNKSKVAPVNNTATQAAEKLDFTNPETIISEVKKVLILPADETPTIATVDDPSQLPKTEFFSKAEQGDKILVFKQSNVAVLFRPSKGVVITLAPLGTTNLQ